MLRPVLLEAGLNVEADIAGDWCALAVAGANGAKHPAGGASNVADGGAVLDEILRELDAVVDQVTVATNTQFNVAIELLRIIGEREGKLGGLIDHRRSFRKAINDGVVTGFLTAWKITALAKLAPAQPISVPHLYQKPWK